VTHAADPHAETLPSDPHDDPSREDLDALVGRTLGHFRLDARLGHGGMGAVYRAWDSSLEREVAVKVLLGAGGAARDRFLREARVQAKLRHPNVVPIHFVGQSDDLSFLVMDIVEGETLADMLARRGALDEARALDIADAIALALEAGSEAHLVHRDVKPSNILVDKNGRIMLADFGLAKNVNALDAPVSSRSAASGDRRATEDASGQLTRAGAILGTPAYLAPEQARGETVDFRADMYSLGVTLYEALTGQPPFTGEGARALLLQHIGETPIAPRVLAPSVRPVVDALVLRLLEKNPAARFASYAELRAAIDAARAKPTVPATFFVRLVAFVIDLAAVAIYASVIFLITKSAAVGWIASAASFGALERAWSTPGKKLLRVRVVDAKGDPPSWATMIARSMLRLAGPIVASIDLDFIGANGLHPEPIASRIIFPLALLAWAIAIGLSLHARVTRTREVFA
jgi:serine/threonine-protein kinase